MAIESELSGVFAGTTFYRQNMPLEHATDEITIELLDSGLKTETSFYNRRERSYRICYFGSSDIAVVSAMEKIESLFMERIKLSISDGHYIRFVDFSFTKGFETETDGIYCSIGLLKTESREAIPQSDYQKIRNVYIE